MAASGTKGDGASAKAMGVTRAAWSGPPERGMKPSAPSLQSSQEGRLRVLTYNLGGVTSELYDSILEWLVHKNPADVVILQETHWGLGRSDGAWTAAGWRVTVSADPNNRYSGVAVLLHPRLHAQAEVTHVVWKPGRLLVWLAEDCWSATTARQTRSSCSYCRLTSLSC